MRRDEPGGAPTLEPPPAARVSVIGSGSEGNAVVVAYGAKQVMADAGFTLSELVDRLRSIGIVPGEIDDVFLTHGHRDHVLAAPDGAKIYGWRLWATLGTVWQRRELRFVDVHPFIPGDVIEAPPFRVHTVAVPHDVDETCAFVFEIPETRTRIGYCTDLGEVTDALIGAMADLDLLLVEANYDRAMLESSAYPTALRERVGGPAGHLSNDQAARLVQAVVHPGLACVILAHMSRYNNTPELARRTVGAALDGTSFRGVIIVPPFSRPLGPIVVAPRR